MKIFVGEYVCGGGLLSDPIESIPDSLRNEGLAMLLAISEDLQSFASTVVSIDGRFRDAVSGRLDDVELIEVDGSKPLWSQWVSAATSCDAALIVAPESDGKLAQAVAMLRAAGVDVVAGSGDFLRTAGDKLLTAKALTGAGVAHPTHFSLADKAMPDEMYKYDRFVVKPRDGCGTQQISKFDDLDDATSSMTEQSILQAWMPGQAVSIAMIASPTKHLFLPAVSQVICETNCQYGGGQGPMDDDTQRRMTSLAMRTVEAMPPTVRGFVGFDMLLGQRASEDYVIEVNPRLTTSYVGLRKMIHGNLAARLFDLEEGPVSCCVPANSVRWIPTGEVKIDAAQSQAT